MTAAKAIETEYHGRFFRSRLEARWAVFLDAMGLEWDYEREGYDLPSGRYLPDFWLPIDHPAYPNAGYWLEVKPHAPDDRERRLCEELALATRHHVIVVAGPPVPGSFRTYKTVVGPRFPLVDGDPRPDDPWDGRWLFSKCDGEEFLYGMSGSLLAYAWIHSPRYKAEWPREAAILAALKVASTARFEHGQRPATGF